MNKKILTSLLLLLGSAFHGANAQEASSEDQKLNSPFIIPNKISIWNAKRVSMVIVDEDNAFDKHLDLFATSLIYGYAQAHRVAFDLPEEGNSLIAETPNENSNLFLIIGEPFEEQNIEDWITELQQTYPENSWLSEQVAEDASETWYILLSDGDRVTCGAYTPFEPHELNVLRKDLAVTKGAVIFHSKTLTNMESAACIEDASARAFGFG